ncbi:MAG TPA: PEP/pyruvate-binding domain-containing protein, partial [Candidatus Limnocylindrales bacterium]|nr:PEP/pyruvate-binding domain-containing protein [Candidatus Limnocylindrales bacterium]
MRDIYALDTRLDLTPTARTALLGGKAAGLGVMAAELGLPVPPGFTITTQVCKRFLSGGWPAGLDEELRTAMRRLEETLAASSARASVIGMGTRRFGDRHNPLLVSVRSGAPVSMPGMMDTILDLGLNDETARGLASVSGDDAFAADCHRRFREMFTRIVGVAVVPADPWEQLRAAVQAVFRSWNSERALAYRRREHIPDDLGTAVTVQAMVFGNLGRDSASGVLFTRNPSTGDPTLYGDVLFAAQGEDVVTGTHQTEPLTVLDQRLPDAGRELRQAAATLERHFADLCDIEFTVERGTLWMLQVRAGKRTPQAALRIAADMADAGDFPLSKADAVKRVATILANPPTISRRRDASARALATGLAASPGIATGEIATTAAAAL